MQLEEIERGLDIHIKVYPRESTKFIEKEMRKLLLFAHRVKMETLERKNQELELALKELEADESFVKSKSQC